MDDEMLIALLTRCDVGIGLVISILVAKGVISCSEMVDALDQSIASVADSPSGNVISTLFASLKALLNRDSTLDSCGSGPLAEAKDDYFPPLIQ